VAETSVLTGLTLATMIPSDGDPFGLIEDAAVVIEDGTFRFVGPASARPNVSNGTTRDLGGTLALPGFIACHNAICWAPGAAAPPGESSGETYRRLAQETAELTSAASDQRLLEIMRERIAALTSSGVTAFELKSGFGNSPREELRLALLCRTLQRELGALSRVTLFAGHLIPEHADPEEHLEAIVIDLVPRAYELGACDAVEVFCDDCAGIDLDQASTILEAFYKRKTPSRVACDRFSDSAGATLPSSFYSRAASYLCCSDEVSLQALATSGTTAILVPESSPSEPVSWFPNMRAIRAASGRIAIANDAGPYGSGSLDILAAARLGVDRLELTPEEAIRGITVDAAHALGVSEFVGTIEAGKRADLALFEAEHPKHLLGDNSKRCAAIVTAGLLIPQT